jgi:hypothetical protein
MPKQPGLVVEIVLDALARQHDDADGQHLRHGVVALEWRRFGVRGAVRLEGDLRHLAVLANLAAWRRHPAEMVL